jgi:hypothetical protein
MPETEQPIDEINRAIPPVSRLAASGHNMFTSGPIKEPHAGRATPKKTRDRFPITGQVRDVDGDCWNIRDVRTTRHGFDLYFGTPENNHGAYRGGLPRLIATQALCDFWEANQTKGHGFLFDLPAGATTLKRLRSRLGFNFRDDTREFWTARKEDLDSLRAREFAARHGVRREVAVDWRRKLIGTRARPAGWWRKPKVRKVLLAGLTLIETGRKLGIGTTHAKRLRDRARLESQLSRLPLDLKVALAGGPSGPPFSLAAPSNRSLLQEEHRNP